MSRHQNKRKGTGRKEERMRTIGEGREGINCSLSYDEDRLNLLPTGFPERLLLQLVDLHYAITSWSSKILLP